jgi:hypothetical protein
MYEYVAQKGLIFQLDLFSSVPAYTAVPEKPLKEFCFGGVI